ncbi:hypothetical protein A2G07_11870 [Deinococcus radiodurans R1 = ATCC 13939 = DSM 20539]|nr:hypothetical protein A2G07_11870 [Deinococcus radiodurans R1 = ATCC 13939 = DSM 20539]
MALSLFDELDVVFGPAALADALFYRHSPALRFELEGGKTYIAQFLQAVDRARTVLNVAFAGMEAVTAVLGVWGDDPPAQLWATAEAALHELGIKLPAPELSASELPTPETRVLHGEEDTQVLFAFTLSTARLPELLWGSLAADLGIFPQLRGRLWLAAPELGLLACPYDSRGMDMIGPNTARLAQLYHQFGDWLLDHDRARMAEMLSPGSKKP